MSKKNLNFKKELEEIAQKEKEDEKIRNEQAAKEEFVKLASNLHHLTSTKTQPGIFKPPFAKENPKAFDIEVETHLKIAF
jgi:formyltetrahydrofolate synthetase